MTDYTKRVVIVVTGGQLVAANAQAKLVDVLAGEFTWTVGLSPSGDLPATHFWCNWQMMPDQFVTLESLLALIPGHNEQIFELDSFDPAIAKPTIDEILAMTNPPLKVIAVE